MAFLEFATLTFSLLETKHGKRLRKKRNIHCAIGASLDYIPIIQTHQINCSGIL